MGLLPGILRSETGDVRPVSDAGRRSAGAVMHRRRLHFSWLRRAVLLLAVSAFLLQFFRVKALVGGLTGSIIASAVRLLDPFAYAESLAASLDFAWTALLAVLPVLGLYLVLGRAFCGWLCPMDFLYGLVDRLSYKAHVKLSGLAGRMPVKTGYAVAAGLLLLSALLGVPVFTNYASHLTNFFRMLTGTVFLGLGLPVNGVVILFSSGIILALLVLEYVSPRLWCRVLCPVGKTYGLFNRVSLLRLGFAEGECGECNLCDQECYMGVRIARNIDQPSLRDPNCIYCGRCVEGCETKGKIVRMRLWR